MQYIVWFFASWGVVSFIKRVMEIAIYWDKALQLIKEVQKEKK